MSGHSKWSSIKHQKGAKDVQRGALFTKLAREITVAVRAGGGGDPEANYRLRLAVQKARGNNMPNDNIERSIKKALGEDDNTTYDDVLYEGFGPGGAAILVQALTDNRNRTVSEVRSAFAKYGGNMGESGSVGWMFANRGVITINTDGKDADEVALKAIDAGAADVEESDGILEAYTEPQDLKTVEDAVRAQGLPVDEAGLRYIASTPMELDTNQTVQALRLIEKLEDLDDVQQVFSNLEISDDVLAQVSV
ncbi:MAG: YebC/PmpR family DNA-binding transcriptional regulator [Thermomicrobia bacterium]|nr:YebC/PmpR family DNA-binding transcriptional regulator [Thermomicrobia bacterium]